MAMGIELVPAGTRVEAKGEGQRFDVSQSASRTFFCVLSITDVIEQESLDVAIQGSADGENWPAMPILRIPQRFYRGETKMVLDLTTRPEVKFIRARWDASRWGRVAPTPMFVFGARLSEVAASAKAAPKVATA